MKVLHITNMFPFRGDVPWRGGFVRNQIRSLVRASNGEIKFGVFLFRGRISKGSNWIYLSRLKKLRRRLAGADVAHCHHWFLVILVLISNFKGKIVYTIHEEASQNKLKLNFWLIYFVRRFCHSVIYVNSSDFCKYGKVGDLFLPCGYDQDVFFHASIECDKDIDFFFPAQIERAGKRFDVLTKAINLIESHLGKAVVLQVGGALKPLEVANVMRRSKYIVSIGDYESDGLVIKEALSVGSQVIASSAGNALLYSSRLGGVHIVKNEHDIFTVFVNSEFIEIGLNLVLEYSLAHASSKLIRYYFDLVCENHDDTFKFGLGI